MNTTTKPRFLLRLLTLAFAVTLPAAAADGFKFRLVAPAHAQVAATPTATLPRFTPTFTRRPTPLPSATRTRRPTPTPTPTSPPSGTELFICSAGTSDGLECKTDTDCCAGTCVLAQGVCNGGALDRELCATGSDCGGTGCVLTQKVCFAGDREGLPCLRDNQCGEGGSCISTGLYCEGGPFDLVSCVDDADCSLQDNGAFCVSPDVQLCSAGSRNGELCQQASDCPNGACVLAQKICDGGTFDGFDCEGNVHCGGGTCTPTQEVCVGGSNEGFGCLRNDQCTDGACLSTGLLCRDGVLDSFSCFADVDCEVENEEPGICVPATALLCSGGDNDSGLCEAHADCPEGACIVAQRVCDGGDQFDGADCETSLDCDPGVTCVATARVCDSGELQGFGCLRDGHCGTGRCVSTGRFCNGGVFEFFSCAADSDCTLDGEEPGTCRQPTPEFKRCSIPGSDSPQEHTGCETDSDCLDGVCVRTQAVCDGGASDSFACDSDGDCPGTGARCRPTRLVCSGGDFAGFACLRDQHCAGEENGLCIATGLVCQGGPFAGFTCAGDFDCYNPGEIPGACAGLVARRCSLEAPCELSNEVSEQVFAAPDPATAPAAADYYLVMLPPGTAGMVLALRSAGGDTDLYVGRAASSNLDDYLAFSENSGKANEELRFDAFSNPSFETLAQDLSEVVVAVIGAEGAPSYHLNVVHLGTSRAGDANCDSAVSASDVDGLVKALFDPTASLAQDGPFGRCTGGDANSDGHETAADLVATIQILGETV